MSLQKELTATFIENYKIFGRDLDYWGERFRQAVVRNGGLATAKKMLTPRNKGQRKGLDKLLAANRPELSVEYVVLRRKFRSLFNAEELAAAKERLVEYRVKIKKLAANRQRLYPDDLEPGKTYVEGAKKLVRVNAYERNQAARNACFKHYGFNCAGCGFNFHSRYGKIGKNFIHVHHLKPLSLTDGKYLLDPVKDLRPVCPNCHAMIHLGKKVLTIKQLRARLVVRGR